MTALGNLVATGLALLILTLVALRLAALAAAVRRKAAGINVHPLRRHPRMFSRTDNPAAYWVIMSANTAIAAFYLAALAWLFTHLHFAR